MGGGGGWNFCVGILVGVGFCGKYPGGIFLKLLLFCIMYGLLGSGILLLLLVVWKCCSTAFLAVSI